MFEHMKNYEFLIEKISKWLKLNGLLFIHIFCHKEKAYGFVPGDGWMGAYFFTGIVITIEKKMTHYLLPLNVVKGY